MEQLKIRHLQITKLQKNLLKESKNINKLINPNEINFQKTSQSKKFMILNGYSFSKYKTNILDYGRDDIVKDELITKVTSENP